MKCPNCGNEVSQEEAFCGHCGAPNTSTRPIRPDGNTAASPRSELLRSYNANMPSSGGAYNSGMQPPHNSYNRGMQTPTNSPMPPNQRPLSQPGPQQQGDFYQDATEAMSALPSGPQYPMGYPQQSLPGTPMQGNYPSQYGPQPFHTGNYANTSYPQAPQFPPGQGYGVPARMTPPPPKQQHNGILVIATVCLVIAILTVSAFGALYLLRGHSTPKADVTATAAPANTPVNTPTIGTTPSPVPTITPTDTPTTVPSPTPDPTAAPDPGFTWCDATCTTNGYIVEYPNGWQQGQTADTAGVQFTNPTQKDEFVAIKLPTSSSNGSSTDLVSNDLQNNYASQPGYVAPTSTQATTIGKENWVYQTASYQSNGQKEQIVVYATIHQGKGYVIELQAPSSLYETANTQYFEKVIGSFQFKQSNP